MRFGVVLSAVSATTITADEFVVVPPGYHGFFDGWNVTQLITENEHDEIQTCTTTTRQVKNHDIGGSARRESVMKGHGQKELPQ